MLKLLCKLLANKDKRKKDFLPYEQFIVELRNSGIKKSEEYQTKYKEHPGWHSNPVEAYGVQLKINLTWNELTGKEKIVFLTYEQFVVELRNSGIKTYRSEYRNNYINHPGWPSDPRKVYSKSWKEFIGKENILPYEQFILELRNSEINTWEKYEIRYKNHPGWPSNPMETYGIKLKRNLTWNELKAKEIIDLLAYEQFVKELRKSGINRREVYWTKYKNYLGWPANPWTFYGKSWNVLIGKKPDPELLKDKDLADIIDMLGGE